MNSPKITFNYYNSPQRKTSENNIVNQLSSHITFIENQEKHKQKAERKNSIFERINFEKDQSNKSPKRRNRTVTIFGNKISHMNRSLSKMKEGLEQKPQKTSENSVIKIDLPPQVVKVTKNTTNSIQLDSNLQDKQRELRLLKMEVQRYKRIEKISHQNQQLSHQLNSKLSNLLQHTFNYVNQSDRKNYQQHQQKQLEDKKKEKAYLGKQPRESKEKKSQMQTVVTGNIITLNNSRRSIKDLVQHNIELANISKYPLKKVSIDTSDRFKGKESIEQKYPQMNHILYPKRIDKKSSKTTAARELHQINQALELSWHPKRISVPKNAYKQRSNSIRTKRSYIHIYE